MSPCCSVSLIDVRLSLFVEDESWVRNISEGEGAKTQFLQRDEAAGVASPVFFQKRLAAASVVWSLLEEF